MKPSRLEMTEIIERVDRNFRTVGPHTLIDCPSDVQNIIDLVVEMYEDTRNSAIMLVLTYNDLFEAIHDKYPDDRLASIMVLTKIERF